MSLEWRQGIRKTIPYVPGEQPKGTKIIKLNTNENPYPPAPGVLEVLKNDVLLNGDALRKYPDPTAAGIVDSIAAYHGVESGNVFVGVGSDDVLATAFLSLFNLELPVIFPDITYSFYKVWCDVYRIAYETIAVTDDFTIDYKNYLKESGGVVIANPNAPTGIAMGIDEIEKIVKASSGRVVIIDEAYIDFGGESALPLIEKYDNILITRTFSKSRSLAGLRVGYGIGSKDIIKAMCDVKFSINSYTMNVPSIVSAKKSIDDEEYFKSTVKRIKTTRDSAKMRFEELGFKVIPSEANFLFVTHKDMEAVNIFNALKSEGIYVRHFKLPRIDNFLRVTIGKDDEMEELFKTLKNIITV